MNKKFLLIMFMLLFGARSQVWGIDVSAGFTSWYSDWKMKRVNAPEPTFETNFMYGPIMSVRLNRSFNIASVFLYGGFTYVEENYTIYRFDSDTTLNYRFNKYVKFYTGLKVMGFYWESGHNGNHTGLGPGLGIGLTYPVLDKLYITFNFSGIVAWGWHDSNDGRFLFNEKGVNTSLNLAYYISPLSSFIIVGYRYQYFYTDYDDYFDADMNFYGPTVSFMYTF
jgi:hypothetical protein